MSSPAEAQSKRLRELGCDAAQGHWFGPAVPPELLRAGPSQAGVSA